jgi:hypothetical protein
MSATGSLRGVDSRWQRAPGIPNDWMILDDDRVILRLVANRGEGYGFVASGPGHHDDKAHASIGDAMDAAEATLPD